MDLSSHVGPVFQVSIAAEAVVAAIQDLNQGVYVANHGSYLRVLVPQRCVVTRRVIEEHLGAPFKFPGDLEHIMTSFKGKLLISEDEACWMLEQKGPGPS